METGIAMTSRQSPTAARPTIGRTTAESTPAFEPLPRPPDAPRTSS
jgi:hypothetical protein